MLETGGSKSGLFKAGFTLIEVMIAVTILAIGMVGVIRGYAAMVNALEVGDYSIETVCLLKERMFEAEREAIEEEYPFPAINTGKIDGEYGEYRWKTVIKLEDSSYDEDLAALEEGTSSGGNELVMYLNEVRVTVSNEGVTPPRRFTLVSYVDGYGYETQDE